jgi:hypothetical protein
MPKHKLTPEEIADIRQVVAGLSGPAAKRQILALSRKYEVGVQRLYDLTAEVRGRRKRRSDAGARAADFEHPALKTAAALVVGYNLDPALAWETAQLNHDGETPVAQSTFRRYLRESGLDAATRARPTAHVRFEARRPLEAVVSDWSACKERWLDPTTRRVLTVPGSEERNHPMQAGYERVWIYSARDKYSRRWFLRAISGRVPTQQDTLNCRLELFRLWGIPYAEYTDNGGELTGDMIRHAAELLNRALADDGGYRLVQHAPRNSRASGAVENSFRVTDKYNRLLGLVKHPTLADINRFLDGYTARYNRHPNRATGTAPLTQFRAGLTHVRSIPPGIDHLFRCRLFDDVTVRNDLTVRVDGESWALPHEEPFLSLVQAKNRKVRIIWPTLEADGSDAVGWFVVRLANREEVKVSRVKFSPHAFGEYRAIPDSDARRLAKELKRHAKEELKPGSLVVPLYHASDAERGLIPEPAATPLPIRREDIDPALLGVLGLNPAGETPATILEFPAPAEEPTPEIFADAGELLEPMAARRWLLAEGFAEPPLSPEIIARLDAIFAGRDEVTTDEIRLAWKAGAAEPRLRSAG